MLSVIGAAVGVVVAYAAMYGMLWLGVRVVRDAWKGAAVLCLVGLLSGCGGSGGGDLAGCWKLSLGGAAGELRLSKVGDVYDGTFTLGAQSGSAFGSVEPNGNYDVMLYTPDKLLWELSGERVSSPLTGTAIQQGQASVTLSAPRC